MSQRLDKPEGDLFLEYALRVTKGRLRTVGLASSLLVVGAVAVVELLATVLADHWVDGGLSATALWAARTILVLSVSGLAVWLVVLPLGRRVNDLYIARLLERAYPEFRNDLTAALLLGQDGRVGPNALSAIRRRAAREAASADVERAVATRRLRWSGILLTGSAGLFLLYALASPKAVGPSIARALGAHSVPAPTVVELFDVQPRPGTDVLAGRPVTFAVRVRRASGPVVCHLSRDGGASWLAEDRLTMSPHPTDTEPADRYVAEWPSAAAAGGRASFYISCGDAATPPAPLNVLAAPVLADLRASVRWPAYTGRGTVGHPGGRIEALPGSTVRVIATANHPVDRGRLEFQQSVPLLMKTDGSPEFSARFDIGPGGKFPGDRYRVTYHGTHPLIRGVGVWHDIVGRSDQPPTLRITRPVDETTLSPGQSLTIAGRAGDDFGIKSVSLVLGRGRTRRRVDLDSFSLPGQPTASIGHSLPAREIGPPGTEITARVEVTDFRPPTGQVTRSRPIRIRIAKRVSDSADDADQQPPDDSAAQQPASPSRPAQGDSAPSSPPPPAVDPRQSLQELMDMVREDADALDTLREHAEPSAPHPGGDDPAPDEPDGQGEQRPADEPPPTGDEPAAEPGEAPAEPARSPGRDDDSPDQGQSSSTDDTPANAASSDPPTDDSPTGRDHQTRQPAEGAADRDGPGQADAPPAEEAARRPGQADAGESPAPEQGQRPGDGQAQGEAQGQGQGRSRESRQGLGQQQARGQGEQQAPGQEPSRDSGQGQGQGPGEGHAPGQGQGQGEGNGLGEGNGQGQGPNEAQGGTQGPGRPSGEGAGPDQGAGSAPAGGMHDGRGGSTDASAPGERRPVDPAGPLPDSPADRAALEALGRAISEARRDLRHGRTDPELLAKLGMTEPQLAAFVERYADRFGRLGLMPGQTPIAPDQQVGGFQRAGSVDLQAGRGAGPLNATGVETLTPDQWRELYETHADQVRPEHRRAVAEYFRRVARPADQPTTAPAGD